VPDPAALERLADLVRAGDDAVVVRTVHQHRRSEIQVRPGAIVETLERLRSQGYEHLMSVHGLDYYPDEPRFGVVYELLSYELQDRVAVKVRVPLSDPHVPSVTQGWPTASFQEREIYDMFGVVFDGHPDLRRILMPDDYIGHPQRRDFPIGGEPILFTGNEQRNPGWWK
jgi:NADH-quinone oxidoreductase subunit C